MSAEAGDSSDWCRAPLLGIALVVDDANKGQRLVFRYPALREVTGPSGLEVDAGKDSRRAGGRDPTASSSSLAPSSSSTRGPRSSSSGRSGGGGGGGGSSKDGGGSPDAWATQQCEAEFHQLSPEVFARLFRPKAQLCGRSFQVSIDRVRYLSHPVLTASATKETAKDDVLLFNVVLATARVHIRDPAASERRRRQRQLRWIRAASGAALHGEGETEEQAEGAACALRPLQEALDRLTKALLHEERRCRYVSREVGLLLQIRESVYGKGWGSAEEAQTMLDLMMEQSALANDLKAVFHGLKDMESGPGSDPTRPQLLEVAVNGWIRFSLPARYPPSAPVAAGAGGVAPEEIVERCHTLLLLLDESELLAKLPADGSEQLRALVSACNPLKTLEELSAATRIAPPQLRLLAAHLVYWGHARVIRTITLRSVYAVKPSAPTHLGALPAMAFQQRFPPHSFFRVLAAFGAGKTLQALLDGLPEEAQMERLAMLVWLLQQDIVEEAAATTITTATAAAAASVS